MKTEKGNEIRKLIIFYSWQSDLPSKDTKNFIRNSIRFAIKEFNAKNNDSEFSLDEATRGLAGSPHIPNSILNKILNSDIFICDITTINNCDDVKRKSPNPNVLIELGFAVAILGWDRIIMLFNDQYGDFNIEAPFDLEKRRITCYSHKKLKGDNDYLGNILKTAINLIVDNNPEKFVNTLNQPEKEKRARDIYNLKQFLRYIHIPTIDEYLTRLPKMFTDRALDFYEASKNLMSSSTFHIYDKKLDNLINKLFHHWSVLFSFDMRYQFKGGPQEVYIFITPGDLFPTMGHKDDWEKIEKERDKMYRVFQNLLKYIRDDYQEVDLDITSKSALNEYIEFNKKIDKHIENTSRRNLKKINKNLKRKS